MLIAFTASAFVYYQLVINIGNMAGNTFLNMFLLGLVEGPGCVLGVYLSDKIGRRWSHFSMLGTNAVLFFVLMFTAYNPNLKSLVIFLCMWIKLNISGTFVVSYVQVSSRVVPLIFPAIFLNFLGNWIVSNICKTIWNRFCNFNFPNHQYWRTLRYLSRGYWSEIALLNHVLSVCHWSHCSVPFTWDFRCNFTRNFGSSFCIWQKWQILQLFTK